MRHFSIYRFIDLKNHCPIRLGWGGGGAVGRSKLYLHSKRRVETFILDQRVQKSFRKILASA